MALNIRQLLARTKPFRPDIEDDAVHLYALTTGARRVCQETLAFQITFVAPLPTGNAGSSIDMGDLLASALVDVGDPTPQYDPVQVMDVYYKRTAADSEWKRLDVGNSTAMREALGTTAPQMYDSTVAADNKTWMTSVPEVWANDLGRLLIYPRPDTTASQLRVTMAVQPRYDEPDWPVDLPTQAGEAVFDGAMLELLRIPGEHQNLQMSSHYGYAFESEMSNLKAMQMLGNSGSIEYKLPRPFVTKGFPMRRMPWPR